MHAHKLIWMVSSSKQAILWGQVWRMGSDKPRRNRKANSLDAVCGPCTSDSFPRYWSTKTLYHGLWACSIMSRDLFKARMAMLHTVEFADENPNDKLRKVIGFVNTIREKCKALYQPSEHVAVDERIVKSKHRSRIWQYVKNKQTKFGIKLWVWPDSANGYT